MIKSEESSDFLNLEDDHQNIMFGPWAQTLDKFEDVPPFYINLRIHDMFLHNVMFNLGMFSFGRSFSLDGIAFGRSFSIGFC
jgi:hypothetical protein